MGAADHRHHRPISTSVGKRVADDALPGAGGPLKAPHQSHDAGRRNRTSSINVKDSYGSSTGEGIPAVITENNRSHNNQNNNDISGNSLSGHRGRDSPSTSTSPRTCGVGAATDAVFCANNQNGSSWELRHHFPPDALVPRAPLNSIFPVAPVSATTMAAHKAPTQPPFTSPTKSRTVAAIDPREPLSATPTIRSKMSESGGFPTTPTRRKPPASQRARARPHTVSTGLNELGLAWAGDPKSPKSEMRTAGVPPFPGASEAIGEGRVATTQHGNGGSLESNMKTPRGAPSADWGATRGTADGKGVVGLTAEVIKSPGVALDRSGRVTMVDKVIHRGVWYSFAAISSEPSNDILPADHSSRRPQNLRKSKMPLRSSTCISSLSRCLATFL